MDPHRRIRQPGPPPAERVQYVEGRGIALEFTLEPGLVFLEAIRRPLAELGWTSAVLQLEGGGFGPFTYVMPALSPTPDHAAFYSDFFRPEGISRIETAAVTFGRRDATPFLHCHGIWSEPDGARHGGHVIPSDTVVAEPIRARAWALDGMIFEARPDPETNFTLFGPIPQPPVAHGVAGGAADGLGRGRFFGLRLRPNQDISGALEGFCRDHGIAAAEIRGGVASIIGAVFEDGRMVEPFATEMFIQSGRVAASPGGVLAATLDVALVDYTGGLAEGRLRRGANPVLMTAELVLEATA